MDGKDDVITQAVGIGAIVAKTGETRRYGIELV